MACEGFDLSGRDAGVSFGVVWGVVLYEGFEVFEPFGVFFEEVVVEATFFDDAVGERVEEVEVSF